MNKDDKKASGHGDAYRAVGPFLTLGIQFVVTILLCVYAGHWAFSLTLSLFLFYVVFQIIEIRFFAGSPSGEANE